MAPSSTITGGRSHEPAAAERAWSDSRLIDACLTGSQPAWSAVIRRYRSLIFSIAFRYRANREDAEDIFQAVCVELYVSLAKLRNTETLRPWLAKVTAHAAYDWKKRHQPRALSHVLGATASKLANVKPAVLEHHTLWNAEELFWQP